MKKILLPLVILVLSFAACKDDQNKIKEKDKPTRTTGNADEKKKSTSSNETDYDITAPAGWEKVDTFLMGQRIVFVRAPLDDASDRFRENVNVIYEGVGDMDLDKYMDLNIRQLKEMDQYKQYESSDEKINGYSFKRLHYEHFYNRNSIEVILYITIHEEKAYIITCSAELGQLSQWESTFEETVRSFRIY